MDNDPNAVFTIARAIDLDPFAIYQSMLGDGCAELMLPLRPGHIHEIASYVLMGYAPPPWLRMILCGDIAAFCSEVEYWQPEQVAALVRTVGHGMPASCKGSDDAVTAWMRDGGYITKFKTETLK